LSSNGNAPNLDINTTIDTTDGTDKWTTFLPYPEDISDNYKYYTAWEIHKAKSDTIRTQEDAIKKSENIKTKANITDMLDRSIKELLEDVDTKFFNNSKITGGIFVYDEYGNLDKVKGLFKRNKTGSYYTYYTSDTPISAPTSAKGVTD
jgi:hypothetical protein